MGIGSGNANRSALGISATYQPVQTCSQSITGEINVRLGSSQSDYAGNLALINTRSSSQTITVDFQMLYKY